MFPKPVVFQAFPGVHRLVVFMCQAPPRVASRIHISLSPPIQVHRFLCEEVANCQAIGKTVGLMVLSDDGEEYYDCYVYTCSSPRLVSRAGHLINNHALFG